MGYLVLLAELSRQVSALPNSRQGHRGCRISNFLDEGTESAYTTGGKHRRKRWLPAMLHDRVLAVSTGLSRSVSPPKVQTDRCFLARQTGLPDSSSV